MRPVSGSARMWGGNETFVRVFEVKWFTPYLLGYLSRFAIALVVPIDVATQVLATLAVASITLLTGRLRRAAGADECWKWLDHQSLGRSRHMALYCSERMYSSSVARLMRRMRAILQAD